MIVSKSIYVRDEILIQKMQVIELTSIRNQEDEKDRGEDDCRILTDTFPTEIFISRADSVVICCSDPTSGAEAEMSAVSLLAGEPSPTSFDSRDVGTPSASPETAVETKVKGQRRVSPHWTEQTIELADDGDEFKQQLWMNDRTSKRYSSIRCNSTAHIRRYPPSS